MDDWSGDRLDSWKEIADYLRRDVTTVLRWEKDRGLPVHRMPGGKRQAVYAYKTEIEAWLGNGKPRGSPEVDAGQVSQAAVVATANGGGVGRLPEFEGGVIARRPGIALWRIATIAAGAAILTILGYRLIFSPSSPVVLSYQQLTNDGYLKSGLVTDGSRVYFVESTPQGNVIDEVPAAGGAVTPISTSFAHPSLLAINPALSEIVVSDRPTVAPGALWILPLDGGKPQRIGAVNARSAAWSSDGSTIAYGEGRALRLCRVDGSEDHEIATLPGAIDRISWKNDSDVLLVSLDPSPQDEFSIWEVRDDGSGLRPMDEARRMNRWFFHGQWGPEGKFLAQISGPPGTRGTLWMFPKQPWFPWERGSREIKLGIGPLDVEEFAPSLIPGTVFVEGAIPHCEFERFDLRSKQLVPYLSGVSGDELNFSPDGKSVAYISEPESNLMEQELGNSSPLQLTLPPMDTELPRWSPDGKWIAFMARNTVAQNWHVYLVSASGGECRRVTKSNVSEGAPTWSPDGTRLAFGEIGAGAGPPTNQAHIHILNLKTGYETALPNSEGLWTARWSPDGKHIAAVTVDSHSLVVFSFRTRIWRKLASGMAISDLDWSKNSKAVYFLDGIGPNGLTVSRVGLNDRQVKLVVNLRSLESTTGWLGLMPDGSPLISRITPGSEIYAIHWGNL